MSPLKHSHNIAARMGRWSARHRKAAVLGWLAFVLLAVGTGLAAGMKMLDPADSLTGESARAQRVVDGAGLPTRAHESVLVQSPRYVVTDRAFRAAVADVAAELGSQPYVDDVRSPLDKGAGGLVSRDRHSALVQFELEGDMSEQMSRVAGPLEAVAAMRSQHAGFRIEE